MNERDRIARLLMQVAETRADNNPYGPGPGRTPLYEQDQMDPMAAGYPPKTPMPRGYVPSIRYGGGPVPGSPQALRNVLEKAWPGIPEGSAGRGERLRDERLPMPGQDYGAAQRSPPLPPALQGAPAWADRQQGTPEFFQPQRDDSGNLLYPWAAPGMEL
jgi:hypothetical protein